VAAPEQALGDAVMQALAEAAGYLALVTRVNPLGSADAMLARPDIDAVLQGALDEARSAAEEAVRQAWYGAGAPASDDATLGHLLDDIDRIFGALAHLRGVIRTAHASVGPARFTRGVTQPGDHPSARAAEERGTAVRDAILGWARKAGLRSRMAVSVAAGHGGTAAVLADALAREARGEKLLKRWRAHVERPSCCIWCRRLDGVTIGLRESFAPYLGTAVALPQQQERKVATPAGARRYRLPEGSRIIYTHPPRLYHGQLQGPLLHPFCQCWLEIVRTGEPAGGSPAAAPAEPAGFVSAGDVRDMPEDVYQADLAFLQAAAHELDQVLKRLAGGSG
jgi:hypothetical protein